MSTGPRTVPSAPIAPESMLRRGMRVLAAISFAAIGILHFVNPAPFVTIVPPWLPAPLALVLISGAFEVLGGVGLLVPRVRRAAGIGLLLLLAAVYPANIYMAVNEIYLPDMPREAWLLWARLPFQLVFAALVAFAAGLWPFQQTARRI